MLFIPSKLLVIATLTAGLITVCFTVEAGAQDKLTIQKPLEFRLVPNKENVVASELLGTWVVDEDIGKRLKGRSNHLGTGPVVFRSSPQSSARIIAWLNAAFAKPSEKEMDAAELEGLRSLQILYLAGEVEFNGLTWDFAVGAVNGTPHLLLFDRIDDMESENVMLARDEAGDSDLLFLGGDFNNQSFAAYRRQSE